MSGVREIVVILMVLQCACTRRAQNSSAELSAAPSGPSEVSERAIVHTGSDQFAEIVMGDLKFHAEKSLIKGGSFTTGSMSWFLGWPGLTPGFAGQPDAQHFLQLIVGSTQLPTQFPALDPDKQLKTWVRGSSIRGPMLNSSYGLIEFIEPLADGKPGWHFYRSPDPKFVDEAGERPLVRCQPTPALFWGNTPQCEVYERLSPYVHYKYLFSKTLLPEWPAVDTEVRQFLTAMIVPAR